MAQMRSLARLVLFTALFTPVIGAALAAGCGESGQVSGSASGAGAESGSSGTMSSGTLSSGTMSSTVSSTGSSSGGNCDKLGAACAMGSDCCSGTCTGNVCNLAACTSDNEACTMSAECCGGNCQGNVCVPLNGMCKTLNNKCSDGAECCSGLCFNGLCSASSFCLQIGDVCTSPADCCGGTCNVTNDAGQGLGVCGQPPQTAANCGLVDGQLCGAPGPVDAGGPPPSCGGACCSRLCAPYGPTGVEICQPASGCHVVGDVCTKDQDCCGSVGLPNGPKKPVTCDIVPPNMVGVCRNPMGCKPDGDVCKLATMSCNASCNCCSGNCETEDSCHLDSVGVPRCSPAQCVQANGACASSADCCNGAPCVPNPSGNPPFVCSPLVCIPSCGPCTINGDCCPGENCVIAQGSTKGYCGPCDDPDGGPMPDGGPPPPPPDGGCALYGQGCTTGADCCNGTPCSYQSGTCMPGQIGCTCHFVLN